MIWAEQDHSSTCGPQGLSGGPKPQPTLPLSAPGSVLHVSAVPTCTSKLGVSLPSPLHLLATPQVWVRVNTTAALSAHQDGPREKLMDAQLTVTFPSLSYVWVYS